MVREGVGAGERHGSRAGERDGEGDAAGDDLTVEGRLAASDVVDGGRDAVVSDVVAGCQGGVGVIVLTLSELRRGGWGWVLAPRCSLREGASMLGAALFCRSDHLPPHILAQYGKLAVP